MTITKDAEQEIRTTVGRLLDRPINDEKKVVEVIVDAITARKYVDPQLVKQAVKQSVYNFENQFRVYLIAQATRELSRIERLQNYLDKVEEELDLRIGMRDENLLRAYVSAQQRFKSSIELVKHVMDMRIEYAKAAESMSSISQSERQEVERLTDLPTLSTTQRDRVRRLMQGVVDDIHRMNEGDVDTDGFASTTAPPVVDDGISVLTKGSNGSSK